jgi:cysteine desulfurase
MAPSPIYLDCAATTPVDPRVREAMRPFLEEEFGNAGSGTHDFGRRARRAAEHARDVVAAAVSAGRGDVVFTSGATESDNLAVLGLAAHGERTGRRHIVTTTIEHSAVLGPVGELRRRGFAVTSLRPTPGGWVDPDAVAAAVRPDTLLVSVMHVNNETGVVQPIEAVAERLADRPGVFLHVDAAQGFGKVPEPSPLRRPRVDLISLSGHKLFGPKGVGALVTRRRGGERPPLEPLMFGGGQERGLRPGTLPVHLIVGLGRAVELAMAEGPQRLEACRRFRARALEALAPLSPAVNGDPDRSVPHILNVSFPGVDAEAAMEALAGVAAVSDGAACSTATKTCSHVLSAMGLPPDRTAGALRLSWCYITPEPDWDRFVSAVGQVADLTIQRPVRSET